MPKHNSSDHTTLRPWQFKQAKRGEQKLGTKNNGVVSKIPFKISISNFSDLSLAHQ